MRSRTVSLPLSCWRLTLSAPPMASARRLRRANSSSSSFQVITNIYHTERRVDREIVRRGRGGRPADFSSRAWGGLLFIGDAIDDAGAIVGNEQRAVRHHLHVHGPAPGFAVLQPTFGEDFAGVRLAVLDRDEQE